MGNSERIWGWALICGGVALLLAGCAVGPDFLPPAPPNVAGYITAGLETADPGEGQQLVAEARSRENWWHELGSAKLNSLIEAALANNPTLSAAAATLRQVEELYVARSGSTLYPQVDASLSGQRQRFNPATSGQSGGVREFSLYNAGVGVRYTFDLAGGNRRALEALAARADYQRYQLAGARLTLAANIVTAAITQAGLSMQVTTMAGILRSQEEQLALTRKRVRLGQTAPDDELALLARVEQTRGGIPLLRNRLQQTEHLLAVLAGRPPAAGGVPSFSLGDFTLPPALPLLVPAELVRVRPDIQAAEALLHAANAEYGVAIAKLYPQLDLSGDLGSQALTTGALFGSGSAVWSLVGQLTQPLFNPGLPAEKRAALAVFDAAAAHYQAVVLDALRNVADVLRALENDAERLAALAAADGAAGAALASSERRYELGAVGYYELLIAQQQSQQARFELIEAQAKRLVNSVAFYQAMGGGWPTEEMAPANAAATLAQ